LLSELTLPKEKSYYTVVLIVSVLAWLGLAITIIGFFYAAFFGLLLWLGSGLLIAHLRAECVRVDEVQLPQLYVTFLEVCRKLGVTEPPSLYVLQAGGTLNAFATRFSGRNFVVVYSDMLDALGADSAEMRFILGHELGHLKSNHILKQVLLAPGIFTPLAGTAYLRACEASCDRHGLFAAGDIDASARALLALGGGKVHGRTLDATAFANQHRLERGFFISWHELTSAYPTLSQRVAKLLAFRDEKFAAIAPRNGFAYFFALMTPGGRASAGSANLLIFVVIIGLMAAMAIPAFQKVRQSSLAIACLNNQRMLETAFDQFSLEHGKPPTTFADVAGPGKYVASMPVCPGGGTYSAQPSTKRGFEVSCSVHGHGRQTLPAIPVPVPARR
jgi:Zn-dependent protease with chaperone function/competence protein ComGC